MSDLNLTTAEVTRFPSFLAMREAHDTLLEWEDDDTPETLAAILAFVRRGQATGAVLDAEGDRRAAQSLLSYWTTRLYRAGAKLTKFGLAEFDPALAPELPDEPIPYRGLDAFLESDQELFFGRESLVADLARRLEVGRLLAVLGASGCGKSSVVRAGLIPALKNGGVPGSEHWRYARPMVPGSNPVAALERALRSLTPDADPAQPLVLVVDQFEEVFTLSGKAEREAFVGRVLELLHNPSIPHRVILTMRTDFEGQIATLPEFQPEFDKAMEHVRPLNAGELRRAIEEPANKVGLKFEDGVVTSLLEDILGEPAALPLLQFTLLKLWEKRRRNRVTREVYRELGGGRQALQTVADQFFNERLFAEEREVARRIFLKLVRPGEGLEVTSQRLRWSELFTKAYNPEITERVLNKLVNDARLLRQTEGDTSADTQIEVAHEALVRNWPTLVGWLEDERENVRQRNRLRDQAKRWLAENRDPNLLWRGRDLESAERVDDLSREEAAFVHDSREGLDRDTAEKEGARQRELEAAHKVADVERRRANEQVQAADRLRRRSQIIAALVALLMALVAFLLVPAAIAAFVFGLQANQNAATAQSLRLAAEANDLLQSPSGHVEIAAMLSIRALRNGYLPQADAALLRASTRLTTWHLFSHTDTVESVAFSPDGRYVLTGSRDHSARLWDAQTGQPVRQFSGHSDSVMSVAFSPDGKYVLTGSRDHSARLWDAQTGQPVRQFSGHSDSVMSVAFSSDGKYVLTGGDDKDHTARLWDVQSGREVHQFAHAYGVLGVAFSPDGKYVLTGDADKTAQLWDIQTRQSLHIFKGHTDSVESVAFSPDGKYVLTGSGDSTARLWDAQTGHEVRTFTGHTDTVYSVAFSLDGKYVLSGSADETARLWDAQTGQEVQQFSDHTGAVYSVAYSPDDKYVLTGSQDKTARLSVVQPWQELPIFSGHTGRVIGVAFSPDGKYVLTGSDDKTARLWDAQTGREVRTFTGHTDNTSLVYSVAFSPDGQFVLTGGDDAIARLWETQTGHEVRTFKGHKDAVDSVAFSPDGKHVLTGSFDHTALLWDAQTGQEVTTFTGHTGVVWSVAFSPDGKYVLTGSVDKTARLWDAQTGDEVRRFAHADGVLGVAFSPDGKYVLTSSGDKTARLWDAQTGHEVRTFTGHTEIVVRVAFSPPDGKYVLTGSRDQTARLWDTQSGQLVRQFTGQLGIVWSVAFSPDGKYVLTGSQDKTARLWDVDYHNLIRWVCSRVPRDLTDAERMQYNITDKTPTCLMP